MEQIRNTLKLIPLLLSACASSQYYKCDYPPVFITDSQAKAMTKPQMDKYIDYIADYAVDCSKCKESFWGGCTVD